MKIASANEQLPQWAGPGRWNDPDMMIVGMPGLSEAQNRVFFSLWCMMAAPLMAGNDLRNMSASTISILTNPEAIAVNQDPLGHPRADSLEGRQYRASGPANPSSTEARPCCCSSTGAFGCAITSSGRKRASKRATRSMSATCGPTRRAARTRADSRSPASSRARSPFYASLKRNDFPIPPIIVADTTMLSLRAEGGPGPEKREGTVTIENKGTPPPPGRSTRSRCRPG